MTTNLLAAPVPPPPMRPAVVRVIEHRPETPDVFTLTLEAPPGFRFQPGQFDMLYVFGVGEAAISLCGDPEETRTIRHTIRSVGTVTRALDRLRPGDSVGVRGPFGSAWPVEPARGSDVVLVTGGIGLPPLRPMIAHMLRHREDYRRLTLLYGARTPEELLYPTDLQEWRSAGVEVLQTVDRGSESWTGSVGVVTTLFSRIALAPERTIGLMCGPEIMMRFAVRELSQRGVPDDHVYVSLERNMHCAVGFCGHCQLGSQFVCMDGPVFRYDRISSLFLTPEA